MCHFFYRLRVGSLRFALRTENRSNGFDIMGSDSHESPGFLCRCALLIRPKKEKDNVDPSSLSAPSNNHAARHTSWCRSGASGCGLLVTVYHSSTTPETSQGTEGFVSSRWTVSLALSWGVSVRSSVVQQASASGLTSIPAGLMGFLTCLTCFIP
jgi:hypothetical protein